MTTTKILVTPAPDCPVDTAHTPPPRDKPTRANVEFGLLIGAPYGLDHRAFSHAAHVAMAEISGKPALDFEAFHAKGQPCMRASPLTKRFGWAAHYDAAGKLALIDPAGRDFARLVADPDLPRKPAMRSKRV